MQASSISTPFDFGTGTWKIRWPGRVAKHDLVDLKIPCREYPWLKQRGRRLRLAVGAEPVFLLLPAGAPDALTAWIKSAKVKKIPVENNRDFLGNFVPMPKHFPTWEINSKVE